MQTKTKSFFNVSLIISFLSHLAVFSIFIFIFSIKPEPHKPKLFFVGSILKKSDIKSAINASPKPSSKTNEPLPFAETEITISPFSTPEVKKPLQSTPDKSKEKTNIKFTFLPKDEKKQGNLQQNNTKEDLLLPPYKPLKLQLK